MRPLRHLASLLLAAAGLALTACGGDGGDAPAASNPAAVQVDSARTASATLGAAGGSVTATAADGRSYTLTVPPGALAAATEITATPVLSMGNAPLAGGLKAAVRFGPAGLNFAEPATLRIEGATPVSPGLRGVGFSRSEDGQVMRLTRPDTRGGAFEIPVFHFSDIGVAQATEAEVAAVPQGTPSQRAFERMHEILARENIVTDAEAHAALALIFAQIVKPALDAATASSDSAVREQGLLAYEAWIRAFPYVGVTPDAATVSEQLARDLTASGPQTAGVLKRQFEFEIDQCVSDPNSLGFEFAMALRNRASKLVLDRVAFGLSPPDTLRRVNDCVRIVIDPVSFPSTVTVGTARSLDAKASLIFASAAQNLAGEPVEFRVTSSDATVATATGLSDQTGRYTVVVTPRIETPVFSLTACYVLDPFFSGGGNTDLCTTVSAPDRPASLAAVGNYKGTMTDLHPSAVGAPPRDVEMTVSDAGGGEVTVTVFVRVFNFFGVEIAPSVVYTGRGTISTDGSLRIGLPQDPEFEGSFSAAGFTGLIDQDGPQEEEIRTLALRRL